MKLIKNLTFKIITATTLLSVVSLAANISEEELGLRKTNLYTEKDTVADKTQYKKEPAGTSVKIARAFENAPPMIPHDTEGMLPITIDNNSCTGCHQPEVASSMGATPIPKSHFTDLRPVTKINKQGKMVKEGIEVVNTSDIKTLDTQKRLKATLVGARFNCSQCHAPQSNSNNIPTNEFKAEFRSEGLNSKSNLIDNINEGVK